MPATRYQASPRALPRRVPPVEYPAHFDTRRVYDHGDIHWQGRRLFVSEALAGEYLADSHTLTLPASPGKLRLAVGLYDPATGERLLTADGQDQFMIELKD